MKPLMTAQQTRDGIDSYCETDEGRAALEKYGFALSGLHAEFDGDEVSDFLHHIHQQIVDDIMGRLADRQIAEVGATHFVMNVCRRAEEIGWRGGHA